MRLHDYCTAAILSCGLLLLAGCSAHKQHRKNFGHEPLGAHGENFPGDEKENQQTWRESRERVGDRVFEQYDDFLLAHVEFDDQGQFWEDGRDGGHNQLDALEKYINDDLERNPRKYANGAVITAFAHGWNNNSAEGNSNLDEFRTLMAKLAAKKDPLKRPQIGIYLSWRGERVKHITGLTSVPYALTYWDRKETAQNIGQRSMGETLKRLSFLKDDIVEKGERRRHRDGHSRLVLVGHSFGGAAIFSGVSRFFEDELIKVQRSGYSDYVDRNWDLVVLVNPAFEALRYGTIHRYNSRIPPDAPNDFVQMPRLMVIAAENDQANRRLLPIGQKLGDVFRTRQKTEHLDQPEQMSTAVAHYEPFITHRLEPSGGSTVLKPYKSFENLRKAGGDYALMAYAPKPGQHFHKPFLKLFEPSEPVKRVLPFMVVEANKDIIDNHGGIWNDKLRQFVIDFLDAREEAAQSCGR